MIRRPLLTAERPAPIAWQAEIQRHIEAATSEAMVREVKRMGSALAAMREKEKPTAKDAITARTTRQGHPYKRK